MTSQGRRLTMGKWCSPPSRPQQPRPPEVAKITVWRNPETDLWQLQITLGEYMLDVGVAGARLTTLRDAHQAALSFQQAIVPRWELQWRVGFGTRYQPQFPTRAIVYEG